MQFFSRLLVVLINILLVFSVTKCVDAQNENGDLTAEFLDVEKTADELLEDGRVFLKELLQDNVARRTIGVILLSGKTMLEDKTASQIMTGITRQIKDTLTDGKKGAYSVKYITDGLEELFTSEMTSEKFKALLDSFKHVIVNPDFSTLLDQSFEFLMEILKMNRAEDVISAVQDGVISILRRQNTRDDMHTAFKNIKYLMTTGKRGHVMNFISG